MSSFEVIEPVPLTVFAANGGTYSLIDLQEGVITTYPPESRQIENFAGAVIDHERHPNLIPDGQWPLAAG